MAVKVALLGDICLTGKFNLASNPDAYRQFDQIRPILQEHDFVVANLESPLTDLASSRVCKAIHIKSPPINTHLLKYLGVSAVNLANNHIFDYGHAGHQSTLDALEAASIKYFGTQGRQIMLEKNNERLLVGGYCCLSAHPSKATSRGVNTLNLRDFKRFLNDATVHCAFPIASVHWGDENAHYPREDHVRFARLVASGHALLLHGHHPHVVQGLEKIGRSLIAYSLGNFCTDELTSWSIRNMTVRQTPDNQQSYLLSVTIEGGEVINHEIVPIADIGNALMVQGQSALNTIAAYSDYLGRPDLPYKRPLHAALIRAETQDMIGPLRFSLLWFARRINYHFIGAFLKGMVNRVRYHFYFLAIRNKSSEKNA
jgi:gamma-polyglutamate biosynthesis protein CapA